MRGGFISRSMRGMHALCPALKCILCHVSLVYDSLLKELYGFVSFYTAPLDTSYLLLKSVPKLLIHLH